MTIEMRATLEFKDIRGIEFECGVCHSKILIPIDKFKEPPIRCFICGEKGAQWFVLGSQDFQDVQNIIRNLLRFLDRSSDGFHMRFDIAAPKGDV
jgi:hypothetical protein